MLDLCERLIQDYLSEKISQLDFKDNMQSLLQMNPKNNDLVQNYLRQIFTENDIDADAYKHLSHLINSINIDNTVESTTQPNIIYSGEEQDMHITEISYPELGLIDDDTVTTENSLSEASFQPFNEPSQAPQSSKPSEPLQPIKIKPAQEAVEKNKYKNLGPGVTLKGRFVLLERLGQGGMGIVFKAKDLLKVEAQDKNPYVAIKVLTEAFKQYSGSFIALQREASKAQKVAHPNIATVYDFDRDGDIVFMTMEYLQGIPLNRLIKGMKNNPIPKAKALGMIEDLCHGLDYAHQRNLIHSDFKPGNCFLLRDGTVKLLDFGIARASSKSENERENTLFDPGKLSAVTPAYATIEMFAGMDPDPRDDIYGLACVSYQLLSGGRHPFNKVAAPKIKDLGITPKPIAGLSRSQQKGLFKALEIERTNRTKTVSEFLNSLKTTKSYTKSILLSTIFILIIAASAAYKPYINFKEEQDALDKMQLIKRGDQALLIETIWSLNQLEPEKRRFYSVGLRREIITHYQQRIETAFNPKENRYDYPKALSLLSQVKELYPDSVAISTISDSINEKKQRVMEKFTRLYQQFFDSRSLLKTSSGLDVPTVINVIKRIDPKHPILNNNTLSNQYLVNSEALVATNKFDLARRYLKTGLMIFPEHALMKNLASQLNVDTQ